jgi:hypothetical protein
LFFDEADSLLSKRVATCESCSISINQNRNTLMQELDRFDGVVIVTTNLFENYDPALLRRIQCHIKFRLPNASMRREMFDLHRVNPARVAADYAVLAEQSRGLSGGDILNVCINAICAGSVDEDPAKCAVTQEMLEREIAKARKAEAKEWGEAAEWVLCMNTGLPHPFNHSGLKKSTAPDVCSLLGADLRAGSREKPLPIRLSAAVGVCLSTPLKLTFLTSVRSSSSKFPA